MTSSPEGDPIIKFPAGISTNSIPVEGLVKILGIAYLLDSS
ncbi:hypothetical protein [Methanosarcina barkeri]|nr:hypothetical protein [Methanosarcina barkeri]